MGLPSAVDQAQVATCGTTGDSDSGAAVSPDDSITEPLQGGPVFPTEIMSMIASHIASNKCYKTLANLSSISSRMYHLCLPKLYRVFVLDWRSTSFLNDLMREIWVEDRTPTVWFNRLTTDSNTIELGKHFTSAKDRAAMIQILVIDGYFMNSSDYNYFPSKTPFLAYAREAQVAHPIRLPRYLREVHWVILTRKMTCGIAGGDTLEVEYYHDREAEEDALWEEAYVFDTLRAMMPVNPDICTHFPNSDHDLDYLRRGASNDYNLAVATNHLIDIVHRLFSGHNSSPVVRFDIIPAVPIQDRSDSPLLRDDGPLSRHGIPRGDLNISLQHGSRNPAGLAKILDLWTYSHPRHRDRFLLYGAFSSAEGSMTTVEPDDEPERVNYDVDDMPYAPNSVVKELWTFLRADAREAATDGRRPLWAYPEISWKNVHQTLREKLVFRSFDTVEIEGTCGFCGTDW